MSSSKQPEVGAAELQLVAAGEARFSYLAAGEGPALVLLHGIGSGARSWKKQMPSLSSRFRVVVWDAPGYGRSSPLAAEAPEAEDYADALGAFLDALGIARAHLVGHSLGAVMAASFALRHPQQVLSLTLASVAAGHARLVPEERLRLRKSRLGLLERLGARGMAEERGPRLLSPGASADDRRAVVDTMAAINPEGYRQAVLMLGKADTQSDVANLSSELRVQFLVGEEDVITPPEVNRRIAAERPGAPLRIIPGAGHAVYLEKPDLFNRTLLELLRPGG